jgi:TolB-like protein/Flp pilus assembly protein TadD
VTITETIALNQGAKVTAGIRICLFGRFTVLSSHGKVIPISSKRGQALLAMLAVAPSGVRERRWLQYKLWSMRGDKEGAASLRQCLSALRKALGDGADAIVSDRASIGLDPGKVEIDLHDLPGLLAKNPLLKHSEFLEGLDIADPEFEDWLREQRSFWETRMEEQATVSVVPAEPPEPVVEPRREGGHAPVVVVLPFSKHNNRHLETHVIDGLYDEVIDQLSRVRLLSVISRSSVISAASTGLSTSALCSQFGADYVIALELSASGDKDRLSVDLFRARGMETTWQHSFELPQSVTQSDVRNVAIEIAGNVGNNVSRVTETWLQSKSSDSDEVSDMLWRGRWHLHRLSKEDSRAAQMIFEEIINRDPRNAEAHLHLAWTLMWKAWATRASAEDVQRIADLGQKAITLDNTDGRAFWIVGAAECWLRNFDMSNVYIDQAIELCPSLAFAYSQKGTNCVYGGHPEQAVQWFDKALRLSPMDTQRFAFWGERSMALLLNGDFDGALQNAAQSLMLRRSYWYAHLIQALAYWRSGDSRKASEAYGRLTWHTPGFSNEFIEWLPFGDRGVTKSMANDLREISQLK